MKLRALRAIVLGSLIFWSIVIGVIVLIGWVFAEPIP